MTRNIDGTPPLTGSMVVIKTLFFRINLDNCLKVRDCFTQAFF